MSNTKGLAPGIGASDRVILFGGVCRPWAAWTRFLIRFDSQGRFKLASVQSREGQAILAWHGLPTHEFRHDVARRGGQIFTKSTAVIQIIGLLPFPWPLLASTWLVPELVRDWLYDRVALNRFRLFGRLDSCVLPTSEPEARFLDVAQH